MTEMTLPPQGVARFLFSLTEQSPASGLGTALQERACRRGCPQQEILVTIHKTLVAHSKYHKTAGKPNLDRYVNTYAAAK